MTLWYMWQSYFVLKLCQCVRNWLAYLHKAWKLWDACCFFSKTFWDMLVGGSSSERESWACAAVWWVWLWCLSTAEEAGNTGAWSQGNPCEMYQPTRWISLACRLLNLTVDEIWSLNVICGHAVAAWRRNWTCTWWCGTAIGRMLD